MLTKNRPLLTIFNTFYDLSGTVLTHSPPTYQVCGSNPGLYVGMMVVACCWSAVYSTEP